VDEYYSLSRPTAYLYYVGEADEEILERKSQACWLNHDAFSIFGFSGVADELHDGEHGNTRDASRDELP